MKPDWRIWILGAIFTLFITLFGFVINNQANQIKSATDRGIENRERIARLEQQYISQRELLERIEILVKQNNELLASHVAESKR